MTDIDDESADSTERYTSIYDFAGQTVTKEQAFNAMFAYFMRLYERTKNDEVGSMIGDLMLVQDGTTADPAAMDDWMECVKLAIDGKVDSSPPVQS